MIPDPSGSHSVCVMSSETETSSRVWPEVVSTDSSAAVALARWRIDAAMARPSGDQDGAAKYPGRNPSGARLLARMRSFLPSASTTISELES